MQSDKEQTWEEGGKLWNLSCNWSKRWKRPGLVWWQGAQGRPERTDRYVWVIVSRAWWKTGYIGGKGSKAWATARVALPFQGTGNRGLEQILGWRHSVRLEANWGWHSENTSRWWCPAHSWVFLEIPPYFGNRHLENIETFWKLCCLYINLIKEKQEWRWEDSVTSLEIWECSAQCLYKKVTQPKQVN